MKKNEVYKGWRVIDIQNLNEYKADGIWLRHEKTGMEIFHLLNEDEENMFSFGFRTIPNDSTGVAHIIEHSVLAGSEHYPLKDPFIVLNNQSIKTYLNAMTFPDKTVYPAASFVEKDYFNLMAVYGDAVFFPLLKEVIFKQEGHRIEVDENGELSIQGVVYNEMKGNYSSFDGYAGLMAVLGALEGTSYDNDSGGNPAYVPELTYEQFRAFHKAYYTPSNCRLFLAGNIPTEKQIDFINERFVNIWLSKNPSFTTSAALQEAVEKQGFRFTPGVLPAYREPRVREYCGPEGSENSDRQPTCVISWILGETRDVSLYMKAALLEELLLGHDGSPLIRVLLESGLGEDVAPSSGADGDLAWIVFTAGLRGVPKEKAPAVEKVIFSELERLVEEGVPAEVLDAAVMALEFAQKEIRRGNGPFSMALMERCYRSWMNGGSPYDTLHIRNAFEKMKAELAQDPKYVQKLVSELLLQNKARVLITVSPDSSFDKEQKSAYEKQLAKASSELNVNDIKIAQDEMHVFQQTPESEENLKKIPHLKISELTDEITSYETEIQYLNGVPVYIHEQPVNGIVYVTAAMPADVLPAEDYLYLPVFAEVVNGMGIGNQDWVSVSERIAGIMGGYSFSLHTESVTDRVCKEAGISEENKKDGKKRARLLFEKDSCLGRTWVSLKAKMLSEKAAEGIALIFDNLKNADFSDKKRLHDLLVEYRNDFISGVVPYGHQLAVSRASCKATRARAVEEMWDGLGQLYFLQKLMEMDEEALVSKLYDIKNTLLKSGLVISMTAEKEEISSLLQCMKPYLAGWHAPVAPAYIQDDDFFNLACPESDAMWFDAHAKVGFAGMTLPAHPFGTKESVYEEMLAKYLSNNILWEKIRTVGGAYGAMAAVNSDENLFIMSTYRDPVPETSLDIFEQALKEMADRKLTDDEMEKVIIAMYSSSKQPHTPSQKGTIAWVRLLYGISDDDRAFRMHTILTATANDIQNAAKYLISVLDQKKYAVIFDKGSNYSGKKVELPL